MPLSSDAMVGESMRRLVLIVAVAALAGCGPARPADAVELSIYARNRSAVPHSFIVHGSHDPPWAGEAGTEEPRSYGCGFVGRDWELIVTAGPERPDPADDFVATASGDAFGAPAELSLWIDVDLAGTVSVGQGVPEWWQHEVQRCP